MMNMTIQFQLHSDQCLYEQIYEHIRREIREGRLLMGERLPSTRSLADYLQVARSTVDTAYGQLLDEGYIEARPCRGYYVCPVEELAQVGEAQHGIGEPMCNAEPALGTDREEEAAEVAALWAGREPEVDFSPNGIDMSVFPFSVWKRITKNILIGSNSELFARGEPQGDSNLRLTISRYLHASRGVNCSPEQIIIGAGNDYLLMLLEKILGRKTRVAMEDPTYKRTWRIFRSFGWPVVTVPMDEGGMSVSALERTDARIAYVMPSHQHPTGVVMPIGRRMELLKWAAGAPDRYLIEDDYDSEFRYRGKPIPSLQGSDSHGRVVYIGTFSKAIAPAIRVSYMVLPESLLARFRSECWFYSCTVSRIDQRVLNEFIRDGYFERHLNKMRKLYRSKHDYLLAEAEPLRERFELSGEYAGLHVNLTARDARTEDEYLRLAAQEGIRVYGMSDYRIAQKTQKATLMLGFGALDEAGIRAGMQSLVKAWL